MVHIGRRAFSFYNPLRMVDITASLAVSKKLQWEDGIGFYWIRDESPEWRLAYWSEHTLIDIEKQTGYISPVGITDKVRAPTAEEVLRELPVFVVEKGKTKAVEIIHPDRIYLRAGVDPDGGIKIERLKDGKGSLANAAAELWIYLKTNDLL
jgi:hypothetical protein